MPPVQIDAKTSRQISELRKLLEGVDAIPEQSQSTSDSASDKPPSWETHKEMKAAWILSSDSLPAAVQDDMKGIADYAKKLRDESGLEPKPDETVEEYVSRVTGKNFAAPTPPLPAQTAKELPAEVPKEAVEYFEEEEKKEPDLPEAVLSKWDQALIGDAKPEPKAEFKELAPPIQVIPPLTSKIAPKKTFAIPKKPSPEIANYMQEAATPTVVGRVIENGLPKKVAA